MEDDEKKPALWRGETYSLRDTLFDSKQLSVPAHTHLIFAAVSCKSSRVLKLFINIIEDPPPSFYLKIMFALNHFTLKL